MTEGPPAGETTATTAAFELTLTGRDTRVVMPVNVPDLENRRELRGEGAVEGLRLSLLRYAPAVSIRERILAAPPGEKGFLALHVTLAAAGLEHDTWLVPGSRVFGAAVFPAARLECLPEQTPEELAATEALLRELQTPGPKIVLEVKADGRRLLLPVREGEEVRTTDPEYTVRIERIFGNFALDPKTGKAHDLGPRPFNPAVKAVIEHESRSRTAWLFSQLPAFSRNAEDEHGVFRLVYPLRNHPHARAEVTIVDGGTGPARIFVGGRGELHQSEVAPGGVTRVAGMTIGLPERITNARIEQTVRAAEAGGRPAVLLAWKGATREGKRWIPLGAELELHTEEGVFSALLQPGNDSGSPGTPPDPGGTTPGTGR